jgi:NAD-reducing hydrogenase large subunit
MNKNLSIEERDFLLKDVDQMVEWGVAAVKVAKDYTVENLALAQEFANFDSNHLSIVREDGALELYDGVLRAKDKDGNIIFDKGDNQKYLDFITEEVRDWSYMKFPFINSIGPEKGWYRVGPLARVNNCDYIDSPLAEKERQEFMGVTNGKPNNLSLAYHWARMIETLHAAEKMRDLLNDADLQGTELTVKGERRDEAVGILEAPRGTLFHHYKINENDQVTMCNLIVSTTSNNEPMNRAVEDVAKKFISGKEVTEGLLNHVEVAIRAYDPCLSCATHAMGQMPLIVELRDAQGELLDKVQRDPS